MKECENCENGHDGSYGSGRFCSAKCARGFSTKAKRDVINKKVSIKLTGRKLSEDHILNVKNKLQYLRDNNLIDYNSNNWNRGLTKESDPTVKKISDKLKIYYKTHENGMSGKHHSKESKEKMSLKATTRNNGYVKTKWYDVFCPYENINIKVQGTWELIYAKYLNEHNILWNRPRIPLKYKLYEDDYVHSYFPDFYLIQSGEYIEIKGHWWKSKDGRVDDKRKMKNIIKQNENVKINILEKSWFIEKKLF
jgi:hypothetical protein